MTKPQVNPAEREKRIIVRAGLFVALGLALAGVVIFVIGKERNLFEKANVYTGAFENVDGLALDCPVRLGGLNVGRVSKISFAPDLGDKRIIVTMEISRRYQERIRKDSIARVTNRGVLGDKAVDLSLGTPDQPVTPDQGEIETGSSGDLSAAIRSAGEIIDNAVGITRDLRSGVTAYTSPEIRGDVAAFVKSARTIAGEIETGRGLLHTLVYDRKLSDEVRVMISSVAGTAVKLDSAVTRLDGLLADVKSGDGSLHALIYDKKIATALTDVGVAADELAKLIHDAKTSKDGAVYQLVYGDAKSTMLDLAKAAADLKALTGKVKAGQGSLGGLINDPTVYEDLKEILGNVKRNRVLRELVRYSISNGENLDKSGKPAEKPVP